MKWKNHYPDNHYFFITSTAKNRLPIFSDQNISRIFLDNLSIVKNKIGFKLFAFVIMPDHWHLLVYFKIGKDCLSFIRDFKRFTSQQIIKYYKDKSDYYKLSVFKSHLRTKVKYTVWKEQARVIPLYNLNKIKEKLYYIHNNPVKRGLVNSPDEYHLSSASFYNNNNEVGLLLDEWEI